MAKIIKDEQNNNTITTKARYWTAVCYPENMRPDWKECIGEVLQIPYAYVVHDKDLDGDEEDRKIHVHIIGVWNGPTTYKVALQLFQLLSADGVKCCNTCQKVQNIRYMYNYLIHDTEDAKKKKKYQYPQTERITGNNFDIGNFEQMSMDDVDRMAEEIEDLIIEMSIDNYRALHLYVKNNLDKEYKKIIRRYSSHFERLCRGNFLYRQREYAERMRDDLNGNRTVLDVDEEVDDND